MSEMTLHATALGAVMLAALAGVLLQLTACGESESNGAGADSGGACPEGGGPVAGPADDHCSEAGGAPMVQQIGECTSGVEAVASSASGDEEYVTSYGNESDDDDCKYRVSFTNTCVAVNRPVTFTLSLNRKLEGTPATGAAPGNPEFFMPENDHFSRSNRISADETAPGTYSIGPVVFDRPGRWIARFHFFERCSDVPEDSPHGHASYFLDVP